MVGRLPARRALPLSLLPLLLSSLLLSPLSSAEDATNSKLTDLPGSNSSTKAKVPNPTVSLSLSLGVSQELNPNPFVKPNPVLSLSLSLSVSEELKANPFDFTLLPFPLLDDETEQWKVKRRERKVEAQHHLKDDASDVEAQRRLKDDATDGEAPRRLKDDATDVEAPHRLKDDVPGVKAKPTSYIRGKCPYIVSIKTSCSSPPVTRDAISLDFGDAEHNEVYAARLDDPASGTFERCSVDTFRLIGPCGRRPCFLYLRRSGRDGWIPEYAKIFYQPGDTRTAVTFAYEAALPDGVWYGFNLCHGGGGAAARPHGATGERFGRDEDKGDPTIQMKTKVSGSVKTVFIKI